MFECHEPQPLGDHLTDGSDELDGQGIAGLYQLEEAPGRQDQEAALRCCQQLDVRGRSVEESDLTENTTLFDLGKKEGRKAGFVDHDVDSVRGSPEEKPEATPAGSRGGP